MKGGWGSGGKKGGFAGSDFGGCGMAGYGDSGGEMAIYDGGFGKGGGMGGGMCGGYGKGGKDGGYGCGGKDKGCGFGGKDMGKGKGKGKDKGKGKGKTEQRIASGEPVYFGEVKSFTLEKKSGMIICPGIAQQAGQDVYVFQQVLEDAGGQPGDTVAFFVHWSARGQPQASSPMIRIGCGRNGNALKGVFKYGQDQSKGFGFIECAETKAFFGRDVYVNKDLAATVAPGQVVCFNAYLNREGMPNAETMDACDPSWEPVAADLSFSREVETKGISKGAGCKGKGKDFGWWGGGDMMGMGMGMGKGKGFKGCGKDMMGGCKGGGICAGTGAGAPTPTGKTYNGQLKSFNQQSNYGFIECPEVKNEFGNDCFVHGRALENVSGWQLGCTLFFEVGVSAAGKPQAINVQLVDAGGPGAVAPPAKRQRVEEDLENFDETAFQAMVASAQQEQAMGGAGDWSSWF
mmetsp:Transcript_10562/g.23681  ORF Transcript_10562/g.23681 Transcript_10562/m.23681 type:complete len:460 (+) Transcript_10562:78-1457(+)